MNSITRRNAAAWLGATCVAPNLLAQERFPSRPLTLIIPVGAGSTTDGLARAVGEGLAQQLGQPVIPVNRVGGNMLVAVRYALANPGAGYNLLFMPWNLIGGQAMKKAPPYDIRKDLIPVERAVQAPTGIFVSNSLPVSTIPELIAYLKQNPGRVNFASSGVGGYSHILTEQFLLKTGTRMTHVPYPTGSAAILPAMSSGDVGLYIGDLGAMRGFVADKRIKVLAILGDRRSPIYPDTPVITEVGLPELRGAFRPSFYGIFVEAGVPNSRVELLANAVNKAVAQGPARERLVGMGNDPALLGGRGPEQFRKQVLEELAITEEIIRVGKIERE